MCIDMNYQSIHDKTIEYIKATKPKVRIFNRNTKDIRLTDDRIYLEIHHILPRSLGGVDSLDNLVEVLPEEHIFLHMLRYKIYRKREDALAIRFMLNGFTSDHYCKVKLNLVLTKKLRMGYSWLRSHSCFLRKTEGWQTEDGRQRISNARKGTMPVRDTTTGKIIGSVYTSHPNVLSGKWVHHSKGRIQSDKEIEFKKTHNLGQSNPNASGLTEEYFIKKGVEMFNEFGEILTWGFMLKLSEVRGFPWIKSNKSRFGGEGTNGYYKLLEKEVGQKYAQNRKRLTQYA